MEEQKTYINWFKNFMGILNTADYEDYFWMDGLDMIEASMEFEKEFNCVIDEDKIDEITFTSHQEFVEFLFAQIP